MGVEMVVQGLWGLRWWCRGCGGGDGGAGAVGVEMVVQGLWGWRWWCRGCGVEMVVQGLWG